MLVISLYPVLCFATSQFNFESFQAIGSNKVFRVLSSCFSPFTCRAQFFVDIPVLFTPYARSRAICLYLPN